ncbi:MAG: glycosyltransferase family 4 protein, partial [Chloroflexi bacterium]|nr:glycosyltransferase family 4 protein [Chloroflexota bacterium]
MKVLLSAPNVSGAGSRIVVRNVISALVNAAPEIEFLALLPQEPGYVGLPNRRNLEILWAHPAPVRPLTRLLDFYWWVPRLCQRCRVDVCFSLGDLGPLRLGVPHVILLHQSHIAYHEPDIEHLWSPGNRLRFTYMRWHFARMARQCSAIIVQTPVMAMHVRQSFDLPADRVHAIPMAVPDHVLQGTANARPHPRIAEVQQPYKLLFLANIGPHKNSGILLPLLNELRRRRLEQTVHLFLTADEATGAGVPELLAQLQPFSDMVTNLGLLPADQVPSALAASSALFLPTLLESFGVIYLEAMACGTSILTSNRDFARWMCGDLALYFDPLDPVSIADTIEEFAGGHRVPDFARRARARLAEFPTSWET